MYRESNIEAYITICKIQWEFVVCLRELKQQLCIDLEGWEGGDGREVQEEGDICIPMADSCCWMAETSTVL